MGLILEERVCLKEGNKWWNILKSFHRRELSLKCVEANEEKAWR